MMGKFHLSVNGKKWGVPPQQLQQKTGFAFQKFLFFFNRFAFQKWAPAWVGTTDIGQSEVAWCVMNIVD